MERVNKGKREPLQNSYLNNQNDNSFKLKKSNEEKNYKSLKIVGQGAFGIVYKALCLKTNEEVAVKKVLQDKQYKNRELEIFLKLNHPNILKLHHYFYTQDQNHIDYLNLVTDYYPHSLSDLYSHFSRQKKEIPMQLVKLYSFQMLRALAYMHYLKISHRDIKPQNILINIETHQLVLCDFGSAKRLSKPQEKSVSYISTRYYRAPELLFGHEIYGPEIDLWAAGCVISEMIRGGKLLFNAPNNQELLLTMISIMGAPSKDEFQFLDPNFPQNKSILSLESKFYKQFKKSIPEEALDLLQALLKYHPRDRISAIDALAHPFFDELREIGYGGRMKDGKKLPDIFNLTNEEIKSGNQKIIKSIYPERKQKRSQSRKK